MKIFGIVVSIAVLIVTSQAQQAISPMSAKLESLRKSIESKPTNSAERKYLRSFPRTCSTFKKTFDGAKFGELYPTYEQHLGLLLKLFDSYPRDVRSIWFGVAANCLWDADALDSLQQQLATFGANNTRTFAATLLAKPRTERQSIIRFLADVENHGVYGEYKRIQENLEELGLYSLEREFAAAKDKRIKERDHAF